MSNMLLSCDEIDRLLNVGSQCHREAVICREHAANFAACVMLGSGLETLLVAIAAMYPEEAFATKAAKGKKCTKKGLLDLRLACLVRIAIEAGWVPATFEGIDPIDKCGASWTSDLNKVREARNLIHPAKHLTKRGAKGISDDELVHCFKACDRAYGHIQQKLLPTG
jgi:hypothetical protein